MAGRLYVSFDANMLQMLNENYDYFDEIMSYVAFMIGNVFK